MRRAVFSFWLNEKTARRMFWTEDSPAAVPAIFLHLFPYRRWDPDKRVRFFYAEFADNAGARKRLAGEERFLFF